MTAFAFVSANFPCHLPLLRLFEIEFQGSSVSRGILRVVVRVKDVDIVRIEDVVVSFANCRYV